MIAQLVTCGLIEQGGGTGNKGGGVNPTTTLTPVTITNGEIIVAIFPLNPSSAPQSQNYGRWSTTLGTLGTASVPDTYVTNGFDILGVYDVKNNEAFINCLKSKRLFTK